MVKNRSRFLKQFLIASAIFSTPCVGAQFDNSIGFGVQYAGVFGWQGSWTQDNAHTRIAFGALGATAGLDVDLNKYSSIGATLGVIGIARIQAVNLNYYPGGNYTKGWRVGIDAGRAEVNVLGKDTGNFVTISFGYSFQ